MKAKVYLRVARNPDSGRTHVAANVRPNSSPLTTGAGDALPTVAFGVVLDIPDRMFKQAEQIIAELKIPESAVEIAAEVVQTQ